MKRLMDLNFEDTPEWTLMHFQDTRNHTPPTQEFYIVHNPYGGNPLLKKCPVCYEIFLDQMHRTRTGWYIGMRESYPIGKSIYITDHILHLHNMYENAYYYELNEYEVESLIMELV